MAAGGIEVARAYVTIVPSMEGSQKAISQELGVAVDKEGSRAGKSLGQKLLDGTGSILKNGGKILGKLAISAATSAVTGITVITKQALSSFKDYEQLTGGVEKLFGDTADTVMQNASKAFATAGLDANAYMEQVTGVAASLIASLDGDTEAAAKAADMAIQDMSDNANVFGTDIQSIQNAYSGFAKGNYGMLDNLKLGYQGTKDEMQRLLDDAEKLSGVHYELGNYADMVEAVHVIQTEMNITGTTAKEALGTIEGSMNMAKGAWTNFTTALAGGGDITDALDGLKTALFGVQGEANGLVNNVMPVIEKVINAATDVIPQIIESLLPTIISLITTLVPKIISLTTQLIGTITSAISDLVDTSLDDIVNSIINELPQIANTLVETIVSLIGSALKLINKLLPVVIKALKSLLSSLVAALPSLVATLLDGLRDIVFTIIDAIPEVLMAIIDALAAIVEMLPEIIQMIVEVLPDLITYIIEGILGNLPMILEGLVNLVISIVEAIPTIIISLVEAIPTIIETLLNAVIDCLPEIIMAIVTLVFKIIEELPTILQSLWDAVVAIFKLLYTDIPKVIMDILPKIILALGDIFKGVWDALTGFTKKVGDWFMNTEVGKFMSDLVTFGVMIFDEVKSFLTQLFEPIVKFCSDVIDKVKSFFTDVFNKVKEVFTNIFSAVKEKLTEIFNKVKEVFQSIYNAIKTPLENAKNTISTVINTMKTTITNVFNAIYTTVQNIFNKIKSAITGPIETAKNLVSNAISAMRNIINNAGFSLPHIKLPHFSISGSLSISPPSVPHVSISWYNKGYDEAQILRDATVFGMANGNLLAGGERGNEVVVGEQHLLDMISSVVNPAPIVVNVYGAEGQDEDVIAAKVIEKIQDMTTNKEVVYA